MAGLRVLVACEFSGVVRRAFLDAGADAWSCDLLPAEDGSNRHIVGDARDLLGDGWDLLIAHPPCTRLCNSGVRWLSVPPSGRTLADMWAELDTGAELFASFWNARIERIAVGNPVMHRHAKERIKHYAEPVQSVQPWQFGHGEIKRTCLWLRNLPPLKPTNIVSGRTPRVHHASPSPPSLERAIALLPRHCGRDGAAVDLPHLSPESVMSASKEQRVFAIAIHRRLVPTSIRWTATDCRRDAYLWLPVGFYDEYTTAEIWRIARKKHGFRVIPVLVRPA